MKTAYDYLNTYSKNLSAYVVSAADGTPLARIVFKTSPSGYRNVRCVLHVLGYAPTTAIAKGCNYDKHTAAAEKAARSIVSGRAWDPYGPGVTNNEVNIFEALADPENKCDGKRWDARLTGRGFTVAQAL